MRETPVFPRPFARRNIASLTALGLYIAIIPIFMLGSYWGDSSPIMINTIHEAYQNGYLNVDGDGAVFLTIIFYGPVIIYNIVSVIRSFSQWSQSRSRAIWACILLGANLLVMQVVWMLTTPPLCLPYTGEGNDTGYTCPVSIPPSNLRWLTPSVIGVYVVGGLCLLAVIAMVVANRRAQRRWLGALSARSAWPPR